MVADAAVASREAMGAAGDGAPSMTCADFDGTEAVAESFAGGVGMGDGARFALSRSGAKVIGGSFGERSAG
ncbi:hypothetical protein [Sphingomonas sp.]|uniref:hypothetical protein n=1 Tax=Sphingomonas sp. TaxID=28214 RepID=UPI0035BBDB00